MKSPHRTHHSRIEPSSASIKQHSESYTLTVKFHFNPWDSPREYPAAYAGDAFATFQHIWDTGIDALQKEEDAAAIDALRLERSGNPDTPPPAENEAIDALRNQE